MLRMARYNTLTLCAHTRDITWSREYASLMQTKVYALQNVSSKLALLFSLSSLHNLYYI